MQLLDLEFRSFTTTTLFPYTTLFRSLTTTNVFNPWLRIYGPNGVLIADSGVNDGGATVEELAFNIARAEAFTPLMSGTRMPLSAWTRTYRLYFAQFPGAFLLPRADEA